MPWKIEGTMNLKTAMIGDWRQQKHTITELSNKYSISRPTVYKWLRRYETQGNKGLEDQSRRPLKSPRQTNAQIIELIVKEKLKNRHRGPKKIWHQLKRQYPAMVLPVVSTIGEWLKKHGLVTRRIRRSRVPPYTQPFQGCNKPNAVWSVDYKGQFHTRTGQMCYPLTISDNYSRYLLACQALPGPRYRPTKAVFERIFEEYGLPHAIRSDNGIPFASTNVTGLSSLSLWFVQLGIIPERIEKGCPQQNGRHERMHRTLKAETVCPPSATLKEQQERFDMFRIDYNNDRPHEALNQDVPAHYYQHSSRPYSNKLFVPTYDLGCIVRSVYPSGEIMFKRTTYYIAQLLAGQPLGFKEVADGIWHIFYSFLPLAIIDMRKKRILPYQKV